MCGFHAFSSDSGPRRYWLTQSVPLCAGKPKHDPKPAHEHKGHYGHPKHDPKPKHAHKGHYGKPKQAKGHYGHAMPAKHEHKGHYGAFGLACSLPKAVSVPSRLAVGMPTNLLTQFPFSSIKSNLADTPFTLYAGKPKHDPKPAHEHKGHYGHPKHDPKPVHGHKGHYGKPKHAKGHYGHAMPAKHEHKGHYGELNRALCSLPLLGVFHVCMSNFPTARQLQPYTCWQPR